MIDSCTALNRLPVGQKARVSSILFEGTARRRLMDLGMIEGTEIKSLYKSPAGNPIAYMIRGAVIALRTDVTEKILVSK
ncbi:MAG: FeoA family protein [Eubacteriales bacterium]|jgi:ferrous iron transport protein A